ncbi:hypothetical protein I4U23_009109 [Adineta vaga]|nr:hypothetical protein I4U23_009109 [Adineta vaga]
MNSVIANTEKNRLIFSATPTPKTAVHLTSFSKRADIEAFQQKQESMQLKSIEKLPTPIESNEIDLTKLIRDTYPNNTGDQFKFSKVSQNWQRQQQQQNITITPVKEVLIHTVPCDSALLSAANKRFILLYNMNTSNILYVCDTQKDETKEFHWDEGEIYSIGHADSNLFYIITSTKLFLYDIIKENFDNQYFLYDTLYKDLLLLTDDLSYKTSLKRNNQIQSTVFDDFCYYLYTNKEYDQLLIKCSLDNFHPESIINLTKKYPDIQYFLGFTVTSKSLVTFLIQDNHGYHLYFCDELHNYNLIKKLSISNAFHPTNLITTFLSNLQLHTLPTNRNKIGKQLWFLLDQNSNCIHCFIHENYLTKITSTIEKSIQSLTIFDNKLILAYSELSVDIIDLDNYFSSLKL